MAESQETSDYPGALDTWVTLTDKEDLSEASDLNKIKAAVLATQTELGTDPAGTVATLKLRLAAALAGNGAVANGTAFPTSPTPVDGQIFYRTDEDTVYIYDGTTWESVAMAHAQIFTADGTFTAPGGVTKVYLTMTGGGGGGVASSEGTAGGGGGGGHSLINRPYTVTPGNGYPVVVGAGGASSTNGNDSTFDTSVIASKGLTGSTSTGGAGGGSPDGANAVTTTPGAAGFGIKGGNGGNGATSADQAGGGGGGTPLGAGGAGANAAVGNAAAANTGGGGGGAGSGGGGRAGGAGGSGVCIVMY